MDTNSNIPPQKKVVSVVFPNFKDIGFGWDGSFTREAWRKACLDNFLAGKDQFKQWQADGKDRINTDLPFVSLAATLTYDDGTTNTILNDNHQTVAPSSLDFAAHIFDNDVRANNFLFNGDAYFNSATFSGYVYFSSATFCEFANFNSATFREYAFFSNAIFGGPADFRRSTFSGYAFFRSSNFSGDADFSGAVFKQDVIFFKTIFKSQSSFIYSSFSGRVNFENAEIQNVGHFEHAKFNGLLPNFLGVDNAKTLLVFSGKEYFPKNDIRSDATDRIAQLKRLAEEQGQTDQMLMFNAFELNAKASQLDAGFVFKYFTWLYEKTSDYGQSFVKPLFWYGVLICLSALIAMTYSTYSDSPAEEQQVLCKPIKDQPPPLKLTYGRAVVEYAMFRAGGLMDFTDTGKQNNAVNCRLFEEPIEPPLMRAWGIFKGIASIALLFLAALGLRNKYRIK